MYNQTSWRINYQKNIRNERKKERNNRTGLTHLGQDVFVTRYLTKPHGISPSQKASHKVTRYATKSQDISHSHKASHKVTRHLTTSQGISDNAIFVWGLWFENCAFESGYRSCLPPIHPRMQKLRSTRLKIQSYQRWSLLKTGAGQNIALLVSTITRDSSHSCLRGSFRSISPQSSRNIK